MLLKSANDISVPICPDLKKISLSDRETITTFTQNFPFHTDFSFENLYLWGKGIECESEYCFLNGNLIVHIRNNHADKKIISILGSTNLNKSIQILLQDYDEIDYVSPEVIDNLDTNLFKITEDRDNFGYVVKLADTVDESGKPKIKNHDINRFLNRYPHVKMERLNLEEAYIRNQIINLYVEWAREREGFLQESVQCEYDSLNRLLLNYNHYKVIAIGAYDLDTLVGFNIALLSTHNTMLGYDCKTIGDFKNLYAYLLHVMAYLGLQKGYEYFDFDVDLGIEGLRKAKLSWHPTLCKKYKIVAK